MTDIVKKTALKTIETTISKTNFVKKMEKVQAASSWNILKMEEICILYEEIFFFFAWNINI